MISVAAGLCNVHPQTLRQYERLGLVVPARGERNRMYSEADIDRIRRIQRLTQHMGVNLAGVELVLKLLDEMDEIQRDYEKQFDEYVQKAELKIQGYLSNPKAPIRKDTRLLPVPRLRHRRRSEI
jgi:MerR family transcriptional regulator/heat shock protein HspR